MQKEFSKEKKVKNLTDPKKIMPPTKKKAEEEEKKLQRKVRWESSINYEDTIAATYREILQYLKHVTFRQVACSTALG